MIIKDCTACMETKRNLKDIHKEGKQILAKQPLEWIALDIIGKLPSFNEFEYIFSMVGMLSKYILFTLFKAMVFNRRSRQINKFNYLIL